MMPRSGTAALAAGILAFVALPALASPAMTRVGTNMRAQPSFNAAVVQSIPANAMIDVQGCGQMWCTASWRDLQGYIRINTFGPPPGAYAPPPAVAAPPPVVVAPPPVVVAPGWGYGWHGGYGYGWGGYGWHGGYGWRPY